MGRGKGKGKNRLPAEQGAWCKALSQDPRIMIWAKGRHLNDWAPQVPLFYFSMSATRVRYLPRIPEWGPLLIYSILRMYGSCKKPPLIPPHHGSICMLPRTPSPIIPAKGIVSWNLHWDFPLGMVSYFVPLDERELLNLHWDPIVLPQAGPIEMHYIRNRTCTIEREEKVEGFWTEYLAPSPSPHIWHCCFLQPTCNMYGIYNPVKFLELPTTLSLRLDGHILFSSAKVAAVFIPSIDLVDIIAHIEAITKFTQQVLNNSWQSLSLLNSEISLMGKVVLQNRRALDIIASQKVTCASIQWCIFIPDKFTTVSSLVNHMRLRVNALRDLTPSLGGLINQWFGLWSSWRKKKLVLILNHYENHSRKPCFLLHVSLMLLWRLPQCSQTATKWATSMLTKLLADCSGHIVEMGCCIRDSRSQSPGVLKEVMERTWPHVTQELGLGHWRFLTPPCPWNVQCIFHPLGWQWEPVPRTQPWERWYTWWSLFKAFVETLKIMVLGVEIYSFGSTRDKSHKSTPLCFLNPPPAHLEWPVCVSHLSWLSVCGASLWINTMSSCLFLFLLLLFLLLLLLWVQAWGMVAGQFRIQEPDPGSHVLGPTCKLRSCEPLKKLLHHPLPQFPLW